MQLKNMWRSRRDACAFLLTACVVAATLGGCVFSDTITEKVYDDLETSQVDASVPPMLVNSATATMTSDALPSISNGDDGDPNELEESLPVFTGDYDRATTEAAAAQTEYQQDAVSAGEASTAPDEQADNGDENMEEPQSGDDGGDQQDQPPDFGDDADDPDLGRRSGGTGDVYHNDEGDPPVIPVGIDEVAAIGNYAVIVSMICADAEKSSLKACDEDARTKMGGMFGSRGMSSAEPLWAGNGNASGSLSDAQFDKLVNKVGVDLVFVAEGSSMLSAAQKEALQNNSIDVYYLPALTSATRIKYAVEVIGKILAKGDVVGAEANYRAYLDKHDAIIEKYRSANGGFAGGFNFDSGTEADSARGGRVTLFVDNWDTAARFDDPYSILKSSKGVAVSTLGYADAPISYYMSAGGVLNNAASRIVRKHIAADDPNKRGIVWQFAQNELSFGFDRWSGLKLANFDLWGHVKDSTYNSDLLWYSGLGVDGFGLGTSGFPAVVCKNAAIASNIESCAAASGQLYFPYPTITPTGKGSTVGYFTDTAETNYIEASIGNSGKGESESSSFGVFVNPKGLCQKDSADALCSWTDGSLESVLETSWAYWKFCGGSEADFDADVLDFYEAIYGHSLTSDELRSIKAGSSE